MFAHASTSASSSHRPVKTCSSDHLSPFSKTRSSPEYAVPRCANWVFAAGGTRSVSFDFERDSQRQIAASDELRKHKLMSILICDAQSSILKMAYRVQGKSITSRKLSRRSSSVRQISHILR